MKYKTKEQDSENDWSKFDKAHDAGKIYGESWGKRSEFGWQDIISIHDFCYNLGCNLVHAKDLAEILINLRERFALNHFGYEGRTRWAQFTILRDTSTHFVNIRACGYGTGDTITFSKKFPPKLKFNIQREICLDQIRDMMEYCNVDFTKKNITEHSINQLKSYKSYFDLIWHHATNSEDLHEMVKVLSNISGRDFYHRSCFKDKVNILKGLEKEFQQIKKTPFYRIYLNLLIKHGRTIKETLRAKGINLNKIKKRKLA